MWEIIKLGLLTWGTLFLMIFAFIAFSFWGACSIWWLLTNNMLDRNTFIFVSFTISFIISLGAILLTFSSEEK